MPQLRITFHGAARTVTGSLHLVEADGRRYFLDCGLYQGRRKEARERNSSFPVPPSQVDAVLLSHAHIDHSGNLPTLARQGFAGPIYASPATVDLCHPMLKDSAHLQEKDAEFLNKRHRRRKRLDETHQAESITPLYTLEDAEKVFPLFRPVSIGKAFEVGDGVTCQSSEAGHMLGSTCLLLNLSGTRLLFSGDLGRKRLPIITDPDPAPPADYLILESTYGDRLHQDVGAVAGKLGAIITQTMGRGGKIIIPSFAVGRTQAVLLLLLELIEERAIPTVPIFVDSPLAVDVTAVFMNHSELWDRETKEFFAHRKPGENVRHVRFIREVSESKALNDLRTPAVIISASGMCEAGRVLHHLRNNIENPRNTILITGFQAEHTLGRKLVDGWPEVPIFGEPMRVRAQVAKINELSGHADQNELLEWIQPVAASLKRIFLVHGELPQAQALAAAIRSRFGIDTVVPDRGDSVDLL